MEHQETVRTTMHTAPAFGSVRIIRGADGDEAALLDLGVSYGPSLDFIRSGITFLFDPADLRNVAPVLRAMADEAERLAPPAPLVITQDQCEVVF